MLRFVIPFFACLIFSATQLHAQVPKNISLPYPVKPEYAPTHADLPCNFAGTFTLGAFTGQSNDTDLDTIYLCFGDQIFIDHNGDSDLSGDPNPATPPGVVWGFYDCPPTIIGDNIQTVLTDPCILPGSSTGMWVASGTPEGDITFTNNGNLQTAFNGGQPILLHFAPVTVDLFATQAYESAQVGFPPGPCVNVNTAAQFAVVYLNAITESGISTNFGNDCLGKFRVRGGFPEFQSGATYTIDISLASDPSIKAAVYTAQAQLTHSADVIFSVPQPGLYNVTIEDGKSCGHTFQINMAGCVATDNVVLAFPEIDVPENTQVCVPITVENFTNIIGTSFSISWDTNVLSYINVQNPNDSILPFSSGGNLNELLTASGRLGFLFFDPNNTGTSIADGDTLFEICFNVIGQLGECSPLNIFNSPSQVIMENSIGEPLAVTIDTGRVCVADFPLDIMVSIVDTSCQGTAAIQVIATGGTAPYQVIWQQQPTGANNNDVIPASGGVYITEQLPDGIYVVTVTDDDGFGITLTDTVEISIPILGTALDLTQGPSCNGSTDGTVTANVFIGTLQVPVPAGADFTFNWSANAPIPGAQVQAGVGAGSYFVTVTQLSTGCTALASGTLGQPSSVNDTDIQIVPASCSGVEDGSITYEAQGGTPFAGGLYDFTWTYSPDGIQAPVSAGGGVANPSFIQNLKAGFYNVTITDANGCTFVDVVEVENIRTVTIDVITEAGPSCNNLQDGLISIQAGATPAVPNQNYIFFWFPNGVGTQNDTPTASTLSDLPADTYTVLAIDGDGCSDSATVVINAPPALILSSTQVTNPTCQGLTDGSITVDAFGGVGPPFAYLWNDGLPGAIRNNLAPGDYCVTVSDPNGCQDSLCVTLALPLPPAITGIDSVSVNCGSDGCLTVNAPTAVSFNWTDLAGAPVGTTAQICGLDGGTYVIVVTDANNCTNTDTVSLGTQELMYFSDTTFTLPSCFNYPDGTISIGVMGGNPPYVNYSWSAAGGLGALITDIQAGNYTVTVTDNAGCTLEGTFTLPNPPPIIGFFTNIQTASCASTCDGTATLVTSYGTVPPSSTNFNFSWSDGSTDSVRVDLCPGMNQVTVTDANNCFRIDSVFIGSPAPVTADTLFSQAVSCNGGNNGRATVMGTGGNGGPYTYLWSNGATSAGILNLTAGDYTVTISDNQGCTGTATINVPEPAPIQVVRDDANSFDLRCFGDDDGALAVTVSGGTGPFTYEWSDGANIIGNTDRVDGLSSGVYTVIVTDANGCTGSSDFLPLNDPAPVQGSYLPWEPLNCFGDQTTLFIDTIFGGAGAPYQFSLDFGVLLDQSFPITMGGGEHYITYFDRENCEYTDTIFVVEPDEVQVIFDPLVIEVELGDAVVLNPIVTGGLIDNIIWTPAEFLNNPDTLFPTVFTTESTTFTLMVEDINGCPGEGSVFVKIDPNRNVYIPNIFIPGNPRGLNDHFNVHVGKGVEIVNFMQVYDRWGELVYNRENFFPDNDNLSEGWDGKYRTRYVDPGVYVYLIEVKFLDGRVLLYRGDVTVMR